MLVYKARVKMQEKRKKVSQHKKNVGILFYITLAFFGRIGVDNPGVYNAIDFCIGSISNIFFINEVQRSRHRGSMCFNAELPPNRCKGLGRNK